MSNIVDTVVISQESAEQLENAWYEYNAYLDLINAGKADEIVYARYTKAYAKFNKTWMSIVKNNFVKDYTDGNRYDWACDFFTNTVTITKK